MLKRGAGICSLHHTRTTVWKPPFTAETLSSDIGLRDNLGCKKKVREEKQHTQMTPLL